jgi:hypothetical protein
MLASSQARTSAVRASPIDVLKFLCRTLSLQSRNLLAQGKDLKQQILTGTHGAGNQTEKKPQNKDHIEVLAGETSCKFWRYGVFARYKSVRTLWLSPDHGAAEAGWMAGLRNE